MEFPLAVGLDTDCAPSTAHGDGGRAAASKTSSGPATNPQRVRRSASVPQLAKQTGSHQLMRRRLIVLEGRAAARQARRGLGSSFGAWLARLVLGVMYVARELPVARGSRLAAGAWCRGQVQHWRISCEGVSQQNYAAIRATNLVHQRWTLVHPKTLDLNRLSGGPAAKAGAVLRPPAPHTPDRPRARPPRSCPRRSTAGSPSRRWWSWPRRGATRETPPTWASSAVGRRRRPAPTKRRKASSSSGAAGGRPRAGC